MEKIKTAFHQFRFKGVLGITLVFALISTILFIELSGVQVFYTQKEMEFLSKEQIVTKEISCNSLKKDTLVLYSSAEEASIQALEQFEVILDDMKVGNVKIDLAQEAMPADYHSYAIIILLLSDLSHIGEELIDICQWVYKGGNAMFPLTLEENAYFSAIENKLGIETASNFAFVDKICIDENFMVGGGQAFKVPDAYDSARIVQLNPETTVVHATINTADGIPVIWESRYGEGKFVVDNFGMYDKAFRGFFAASLSLLEDVFIYPVINGSTFYLDDFPSQIPEGNSTYITRDYGTTIRDFYINIWWPDMMNLADQYGIKYTGLAIECYDNVVDGTTDATPDTSTFLTFGNMLLRKGGEIGYHGYNHQPLCLSTRDYHGIYDYKTWSSYDAMEKAFQHLVDFCDELFPDIEMSTYVPPSNLLADEGRELLTNEFKEIKTLSGIYLPDDVLDFTLIQEYEVDENGVVDQPRIISGCNLDDYMTLAALSELNFHYINNHFTHPDDALDPERGAELGWKQLYQSFEKYLDWLFSSAPNLRSFTGSEFSAAVQRFVAVAPQKNISENNMVISIENFVDDAQLMVRFNEKNPQAVDGGELTHITGDLYLLEANESTVTVHFE